MQKWEFRKSENEKKARPENKNVKNAFSLEHSERLERWEQRYDSSINVDNSVLDTGYQWMDVPGGLGCI